MPDRDIILKTFTRNFVQKERRERSMFELGRADKRGAFINRLNHRWAEILDMRYFRQIEIQEDVPPAKQLEVQSKALCYIISHYDDCDDIFLPFSEAFDKIYGRGLASLIINTAADTVYLETEQVQGPPPRFIGRRQ